MEYLVAAVAVALVVLAIAVWARFNPTKWAAELAKLPVPVATALNSAESVVPVDLPQKISDLEASLKSRLDALETSIKDHVTTQSQVVANTPVQVNLTASTVQAAPIPPAQ